MPKMSSFEEFLLEMKHGVSMADKKNIFYFASLYGISCFFQPEENEIVPKNAFCGFMLDVCNIFARPIISFLSCGFPVKVYKRTITREELRTMGLVK